MYNSKKPSENDLPSSSRLIKSTLLALLTAAVLLVTVILPSEYAIDPTGAGRLLGLTEMGEIKTQLAAEAAADRLQDQQTTKTAANSTAKPAAEAVAIAIPSEPVKTTVAAIEWQDEVSIALTPGQGAEVKLTMDEGKTAQFFWISRGGPVNFDTHGDGSGRSISYEKGRGVPEDTGELVAAFKGNHGWFFRNRNKNNITVILKTRGEYGEMKRVL